MGLVGLLPTSRLSSTGLLSLNMENYVNLLIMLVHILIFRGPIVDVTSVVLRTFANKSLLTKEKTALCKSKIYNMLKFAKLSIFDPNHDILTNKAACD